MHPSVLRKLLRRSSSGFSESLTIFSPCWSSSAAASTPFCVVPSQRHHSSVKRRYRHRIHGSLLVHAAREGPPRYETWPYFPALRKGTGAIRTPEQSEQSANPAASSGQPSFEEDCRAVEDCNLLINARLDIPSLKARLAELDRLVEDPKLYEDSMKATEIVKERAQLEAKLETVERLTTELQTWRDMYEMAVEEGEEALVEECVDKVGFLRKEAERTRAETLLALSGVLSPSNCYLELQAGAGGTESHDWTSMLLRMYTRWAEAKGFSVRPLHSSPGDEAGLRSVMVFIDGKSAYGWLRREAGVHRLVRNSPYDPTGRRHTSFSQVRVYPEAGGARGGVADLEIPSKDLRVDTMRAQGSGGQHVNTTESAVRVTHLPTGLVALSQSDRSQHKNREAAMHALRAKIAQHQEEEMKAKRSEYASGLGDNAFGNQIRSYVLTPYQMVKDHRTGRQEGDVAAVLEGHLDGFIDGVLIAEHVERQKGAGS
ncbi:unnamed protein product [Ascophyllum nodosum]